MKRLKQLIPGYDKRHEDPTKNYGIHCSEIRYAVIGRNGAVEYTEYTGVFPESTGQPPSKAFGAHVSFHAHRPWYKRQYGPMKNTCHLLHKQCWCDTGYIVADLVFRAGINAGEAGKDEAIYAELEKLFADQFGKDVWRPKTMRYVFRKQRPIW